MARRSNTPTAGQGSLIDDPADKKRRVELAVDRAIRAAQRAGDLEEIDAGAFTLARELARTIDYAGSVKHDAYGVAAASRELREVLARLRLDPASRQSTGGKTLEEVFAELKDPEQG